MYATGCSLPSCSCVRHAPIARSNASVSILVCFFVSNIFKTGSLRYSFFKSLNACCSLAPHCYFSFVVILVKLVRDIAR